MPINATDHVRALKITNRTIKKNTMGRQKTFEPLDVLDRVVDVFWRKGYDGASMDDLVAASGIQRASLYNAFGGKKRLFLASVDRYWTRVASERSKTLSDTDPRRAIECMFESLLDRMQDVSRPLGCLVTNASVDAPGHADDIGRQVNTYLGALEQEFHDVLTRATGAGLLRENVDARSAARFLVTTLRGMAVMHRINADPNYARDVARVALAGLFRPDPIHNLSRIKKRQTK